MNTVNHARNDTSQLDRDETINLCDTEIENYLQNLPDVDQYLLDHMFEQAVSDDEQQVLERDKNLLNDVVVNMQRQSKDIICNIDGIRCCAHSLQLCIKKTLKNVTKSIENLITISREITKAMRLDSTAHEFKLAEIKYTIFNIDVGTRWCSTYSMVNAYFSLIFNL